MNMFRQRLRAFGALPAAVLVLFLVAQVDRVGHFHGADDPVGDCAQCQHYNGPAVVSGAGEAPLPVARRVTAEAPSIASPLATHYRLLARGPPALS
jgi:hypothetical protein